MAEQIGIVPIKGTMNNMTFYKSADGIRVKMQSKISKEKIRSSENFERTRENNTEFGSAGKAGMVLRNAVRSMLKNSKDRRLVSRLLTVMLRAVKADPVNKRGERNVLDGDLGKLNGFNFNIEAPLHTTLTAPYTHTVDRLTGKLTINVPPYIPADMLVKPLDATHFRLVSAACEIDFEQETSNTVQFEDAYQPIGNINTPNLDILHQLTANSQHPLFLVLGVQYFELTNGIYYPLKGSGFNSLAIVEVSTV